MRPLLLCLAAALCSWGQFSNAKKVEGKPPCSATLTVNCLVAVAPGGTVYGGTVTVGSVTPPGSSGQVVYNDGATMGADAGFAYNKATQSVGIKGVIVSGQAGVASGKLTLNPGTSGTAASFEVASDGTNIAVSKPLKLTGATGSKCLNTDANGLVTEAAGACGAGVGSAPYSCSVSAAGSVVCTHNLNTSTPWVTCYDGSGNMLGSTGSTTSLTSVVATSANVATLTFSGTTTATCVISTGSVGPKGDTGATGTGSGDVLGPATNTSGYIPVWSGANNKTLADGINPATLKVRTCEIAVGDPGAASPILADDNDSPGVCGNLTGATLNILEVKCAAFPSNTGSPTVLPIVTAGASNSILSSAIACGNATFGSAGTLQGSPTQADGATIDANIATAGGTAKYIVIRVKRTL